MKKSSKKEAKFKRRHVVRCNDMMFTVSFDFLVTDFLQSQLTWWSSSLRVCKATQKSWLILPALHIAQRVVIVYQWWKLPDEIRASLHFGSPVYVCIPGRLHRGALETVNVIQMAHTADTVYCTGIFYRIIFSMYLCICVFVCSKRKKLHNPLLYLLQVRGWC